MADPLRIVRAANQDTGETVDKGASPVVGRGSAVYVRAKGNQSEWHAKFQQCMQKSGEQYLGHLRMMADKAYPKWSMEQWLELVKDQFIQGVHSSSMQLQLMKTCLNQLKMKTRLSSQHS